MSNMSILPKSPFKYITLEENLAAILREMDIFAMLLYKINLSNRNILCLPIMEIYKFNSIPLYKTFYFVI